MMLNNLGYSQLLRGDLRKARKYFLAAYEAAAGQRHHPQQP
jgi:Flp pilus assembly protein TadD